MPASPKAGFGDKYAGVMPNMIGYMVTWTTYGSWLPGDERGYTEDGRTLPPNPKILTVSRKLQKSPAVKLDSDQKKFVRLAILGEAERIGHAIAALAVCKTYVHLVALAGDEPIETIVSRYKNVSMFALCGNGLVRRIWTRGFDKRFCFDEKSLNQRIEYVNKHTPD